MPKIFNWTNSHSMHARVENLVDCKGLEIIIDSNTNLIARGEGRSYGDCALNNFVLSTLRFCKILFFDDLNGIIKCESGLTIEELIKVVAPLGWFPCVIPGTKHTTVGGAIACDIHGKNHHLEGSFSSHLMSIDLMLSGGIIVSCSRENNSELFWSTCGGMGLTGVVLNATFRLKPIQTAYIHQETIKTKNLSETMDLFRQSRGWTYTVAWIESIFKGTNMGRGIFMRGEHVFNKDLIKSKHKKALNEKGHMRLNIPFFFPDFVLNKYTSNIFNFIYYYKHIKPISEFLLKYDRFFFPLDFIHNWNKIYGRRGFIQYQFVLPIDKSELGLKEVLKKISESDFDPFLAVLKLFGKQDGYMSFPMEGYSLALDFPIKIRLFEFFDRLDEIIINYGGRLYLAKDSRMKEEMFFKSYPGADIFAKVLHKVNKNHKFKSLLSDRIGLTR